MINKIVVKGYKSIKEQAVELLPINILIGGNGIGKSNFISIFTLIRNLYEQNLQNYILTKGGADCWGKKRRNISVSTCSLPNVIRKPIIALL